MNVEERTAIIKACGGDLKRAAKVIHRRNEKRDLIVWRLRQPWPEEEEQSLQDEVQTLRERVEQLQAQVDGRRVVFQPLMPVRVEPMRPTSKGGVAL